MLIASLAVLPQSSYANPRPSIEQVQAKVSRLFHDAEIASERYNTVKTELKQTQSKLGALKSDVASQQTDVDALRDQVGQMAAMQAQSTPLGQTVSLLGSTDPDAFLDSLAASQAYNAKQLDLLDSYEAQNAELDVRVQQLQSQIDAIAAAKSELADYKSQMDGKAQAAKDILDQMKAKRAARIAAIAAAHEAELQAATQTQPTPTSRSAVRVPTSSVPASGRAQVAIDFALAQVGDAYVYGAAGPDAWDCSGLTMGAWGAAGVSLSHSSSVQASTGTPVSLSSIAPGDLVFYYSPISHVGMYIGNGQVVHAPNPSTTVEVVPIDSMPMASIRRVG